MFFILSAIKENMLPWEEIEHFPIWLLYKLQDSSIIMQHKNWSVPKTMVSKATLTKKKPLIGNSRISPRLKAVNMEN